MNRRLVTSALAVATLTLAAIGAAAPASAATQTENFANCQAALNGQSISVPSGEDLLITFTACDGTGTDNLYLGSVPVSDPAASVTISGGTFSRGTSGGNWTITGTDGASGPLPGGTYTVYYRFYRAVSSTTLYSGSFTVNVASPAPGPSQVSSSGPASVIQQFGKPVSGTCDANQPDGLNWAGVPSGGWTESWAEWMNGGAGGSVCTRTLVYRGAGAGWGVL